MARLANFVLFQLVWFAAVLGAAQGLRWWGPVAALAFLAIHLGAMVPQSERRRELTYLIVVCLVGSFADTLLLRFGLLAYPGDSGAPAVNGPFAMVPPWIASLWLAFAMLPRFSLRWLAGRRWLAAAFGAVGGPLSFYAGTRIGPIAAGPQPLVTLCVLAIEYAVLTPAMLELAPARRLNRAAGA